jgi:hypothetical protein
MIDFEKIYERANKEADCSGWDDKTFAPLKNLWDVKKLTKICKQEGTTLDVFLTWCRENKDDKK